MKYKIIAAGSAFLILATAASAGGFGYGHGKQSWKRSCAYNPSPSQQYTSCQFGAYRHAGFSWQTSNIHYSDGTRPDADGDGIPNGRDEDFSRQYLDENGDGVCDHHGPTPEPASNPDTPTDPCSGSG